MKINAKTFASKVARRAFLLFIGCALIPVSVLAFFAIRQVTTELRGQTERRMRQASKAVGLELHRRLLSLDSAIGQRDDDPQGIPEEGVRRPFIGVELVIPGGTRQTFSGQPENLPPFTPEQLRHLTAGETVLSTQPGSERSSRFFLSRAEHQEHPDGAILQGEIDPEFIWATEDDSMLDRGITLLVLNEAGQVLFSSMQSPLMPPEAIGRVQRGAAGQFTWNDPEGKYLASYWSLFLKNKFLEPRWIIVLNRETGDIFAPIAAFRRTFLLVSLLSLLVVLWLSSVQIRKILHPLARLQEATKRLALGRLDTRVEVTSGDEFETLAASFNQMAGQLGRQFDAVTMRSELTIALSRNEPTKQVLQSCMEIVVRNLRVAVAGVWLIGSDRRSLDRCAVYGTTASLDALNDEPLPLGHGEIGRVAEEGRPYATNTLSDDSSPRGSSLSAGESLIGFAGHPLVIDGRTEGVAAVYALRPLDVVDLASFASAAAEIAQGIARRRAAEALRGSEEQVRQLQKTEAVGRLACGIAHDFNNLLTVIMGYSQMLTLELNADDPRRENVQVIEKTVVRAAQLTRQLLAFSRKQVLAPTVLDLNALIEDMTSILHRLIGASIELNFKPTAQPALMKVDRGQLEQVIVNLVVNARDAMPGGGLIAIETAIVELDEQHAAQYPGITPGTHVMLKVTDTGTGMDAVTRSKIFEPFFTTKEPGKGTGLGLATVFGIVTQSGGSIHVDSELGRGTSFIFYFPRASGQVEAPRLESPAAAGGDETVLIVEDEEAVRTLLEKILRSRGYEVISAARPSDALRIADRRKEPIHLLLTDMVMPEMSGALLSARLCAVHREIIVLQMSGYTDYQDEMPQATRGRTAFLQKPFTADAVARAVREALDSARAASAS